MNWLIVLILCAAFLGILKLLDNALAEELMRRKRARRLQKSQIHAMQSAEELIVFDQTLTREALVRVWEELQC